MGDRLATRDVDRKLGGLCPLGEQGPHLTQRRLGRAIYRVAQQIGHNSFVRLNFTKY